MIWKKTSCIYQFNTSNKSSQPGWFKCLYHTGALRSARLDQTFALGSSQGPTFYACFKEWQKSFWRTSHVQITAQRIGEGYISWWMWLWLCVINTSTGHPGDDAWCLVITFLTKDEILGKSTKQSSITAILNEKKDTSNTRVPYRVT